MSAGGSEPTATVRLRIDLAYDGSGFSGWASQPGRRTVQHSLESALATVQRLPREQCVLTVAGRTDAGVHARGQVCHVDLPALPGDLDRLSARLNRLLAGDVVIRRIVRAPAGFDARFSAAWRRYAYRICDQPAELDPLRRGEVLVWLRRLDEQAMNEAAAGLLGEHDFAAFCKRRVGATTIRRLDALVWERKGARLEGRVIANAFCHTMVRALVGCLITIGEGRQPPSWAADVLRAGRRDSRVRVVPPHGLTLEEVGYPPDDQLAARAGEARAFRG